MTKASGGYQYFSPDSIQRGKFKSRQDPFDDENEEAPPPETASVNGNSMEVIAARNENGRASDLVRRGTIAHRDQGALQARNRVWEDIANKLLPPEESEIMVKFLEKTPDENIKRTYVEGVVVQDVDESAASPWVGLTFLPGADKPQVTRQEQFDMAGGIPDQKDAMWRVNTAASLLMNFEVSTDLTIVQRYNAEEVQEIVDRERGKKSPITQRNGSRSGRSMAVVPRIRGRDPITIDSEKVKIVNSLQENQWDLQSTLIEVDGSSLLNLIVNYRHLISRGGPDMTFDEAKTLLDTMIEDARRLCVRSPVLFRMSTRGHIINSKNTRYGISHRSMFRTITTSQGIKEIVSLSASYYNSLDPQGSNDRTQELIRPRFLQMIVMLLSLLNDDDLYGIADFLESTYRLKADRKHLELLFLKVIPLVSINSKVFLRSLVPAFEGWPLPPRYTDTNCWDVFVERIMKEGYLLPGTTLDLGREQKSWIVKWPEDGFKSTQVFNNLQYAAVGCRSRTINDIPPIEVHPDAALKEIPVIFTNGQTYTIDKDDLNRITCLTPGDYNVQQTIEGGGRNYDIVISENQINGDLNEAIRKTNTLVGTLNILSGFIRKGLADKIFRRKDHEITLLNECKSSGRITKNIAELNGVHLAVAYKLEGRKITVKDAMRTMAQDVREMNGLISQIEHRITEISTENADKGRLRYDLKEIKVHISNADLARRTLADLDVLSDEPIAKVLTAGLDGGGSPVWFDYVSWYKSSHRHMHLEAKRSTVQRIEWLSGTNIEITLSGINAKYYVSPLKPVLETEQEDEIRRGDIALLAGQYMILAENVGEDQTEDASLFMLNYLRITSVEEANATRRGRNRGQQGNPEMVSLFR